MMGLHAFVVVMIFYVETLEPSFEVEDGFNGNHTPFMGKFSKRAFQRYGDVQKWTCGSKYIACWSSG